MSCYSYMSDYLDLNVLCSSTKKMNLLNSFYLDFGIPFEVEMVSEIISRDTYNDPFTMTRFLTGSRLSISI